MKLLDSEILKPLANFLTKEIRNELLIQGHYASGDLDKSIETTVSGSLSQIEVIGSGLKYSVQLNNGRKAGKFVPTDKLLAWIRQKKIVKSGEREKTVLYRINHAIKRKGTPTSGDTSKKFFVSKVLDKNQGNIQNMLQQIFDDKISLIFDDILLNKLDVI